MDARDRSLTQEEVKQHLSGIAVLFQGGDAAAGGRVFMSLGRAGCRVRLARRLVQALEMLDSVRPALIVIDADCNETDPAEAVSRLRQTAVGRAAIVVALGTRRSPSVRRRIEAAGCSRYLPKPVDTERFAEVLLRRVPALGCRAELTP